MSAVRAVRVVTWIGFGGAILAFRRWPKTTRRALWVAASTIGLAHGAADDGLLADLPGARIRRRSIALAYGACAGAVYALARRAPRSASRTLFALTWFHFGSGDASFARACAPRRDRPFEWIVLGALPISASLSRVRLAALGIASALAVDGVVRGRFASALDLALPALAFGVAPSRDTFLAYFSLWHTPRHLALIVERYARGERRAERLARFARYAAPNTIAAFAIAIPLVRTSKPSPQHDTAPRDDAGTAFILAITVPHLIAVALLEGNSRESKP